MERIFTVNNYLKEKFGEKVIKLSIDGGFTCPNRDGTKGISGCTFCSSEGSGELASNISDQIQLIHNKWSNVNKFLAYFQSHTNTYAPVEHLRKLYFEALEKENIVGIVIATRPDCLNDDVLELLDEINQKYFLWVELGLQTIHEKTAIDINRCYSLDKYNVAIDHLNKLNIKYVTHLILGLPNESRSEMLESVKYVCNNNIFGIKLHMLNIVKGTALAQNFENYTAFTSIDDYVNFVCDIIEIIPQNITIHRLNGDVPRKLLIAPEWSYKKRTILNGITKELKRRNSYQGSKIFIK